MKNTFTFESLRARYFAVAFALAAVAAFAVLAAYFHVTGISATKAENAATRAEILSHSREIRVALWQAREAVQDYFSDPTSAVPAQKLQRAIEAGRSASEHIASGTWANEHRQKETLHRIAGQFLELPGNFQKMQNATSKEDTAPASDLHRDQLNKKMAELWSALLTLDDVIEADAAHDAQELAALATTQTHTSFILAAFGILLLGCGYIALDRTVLRPIAAVSRALKAEAMGGKAIHIGSTRIAETRDLIDAFSEMRQQVTGRQSALEHQAFHDTLTGLPNRTLLVDRLHQAIQVAKREKRKPTLLMLDLDRFKDINDTLGHLVGDKMLKQIGGRLSDVLRKVDTVARLGGDEFAILLTDATEEQARLVATKLQQVIEQVIVVDSHQLYVGASIGIAYFPEHGQDVQTLTQHADTAMYVAKSSRISPAVYDPDTDQHSIGRLTLNSDLRQALSANELELHFQPKLDLKKNRVTGAEALLRWRHPSHGPIPPDQVVPMAEQTGLIKPLTFWVLDAALRQCAAWNKQGLDLSVAVNLSPTNLQDTDLPIQVQEHLQRHDLPASKLVLEITESAMMMNPTRAIAILEELDAMGVSIAIDDFGTGLSSLSYLKRLPVDELKIDKSFVMDMQNDENDAMIVRSTVELAHNLGLRVVAEGVEKLEIQQMLALLGCDEIQGYYLSRPQPGPQFIAWVIEHRSSN